MRERDGRRETEIKRERERERLLRVCMERRRSESDGQREIRREEGGFS
jgi:hypothetical protein